jgi:hypothetical protein
MDEPRTNHVGPARSGRGTARHLAFGVLRTAGMLVLALLAILVLLPAMIAGQPTFLG